MSHQIQTPAPHTAVQSRSPARSMTRPRLALTVPALALLLTGCGASHYDVDATQCTPSAHQILVGRNIGEVRLPPNLRVREVPHHGATTQDFNPNRLTLFLDAKGWITRIACG
ncbi:MAG: hypothetical protein P3W94_010985 [Paracoccus sp. (in: a-proteobacteria)]|nr:hypothetical protein [Paracoccus sp. (in: a-proteobacteria)]